MSDQDRVLLKQMQRVLFPGALLNVSFLDESLLQPARAMEIVVHDCCCQLRVTLHYGGKQPAGTVIDCHQYVRVDGGFRLQDIYLKPRRPNKLNLLFPIPLRTGGDVRIEHVPRPRQIDDYQRPPVRTIG